MILTFPLQRFQGPESFGFVDQIRERDPYYILNEWLYGEPKGNQLFTESTETPKMGRYSDIQRYGMDINSMAGTEVTRLNKKRVTIHMKFQKNKATHEQQGKLIILPDSLEELLRVAGKLYLSSNINEPEISQHDLVSLI